DVNGDGRADIITTNRDANTTSVLIGSGTGTFAAKVDYTTGSSPESVTTADVNGDGKADIITANYLDKTISVLINGASLLTVSSAMSATSTSSDKSALILQAAAGQTADIFRIQNATDMKAYFNVTATGDIGIGVGSPNQKLDVNGNINARGDLYVGSMKRIDSAGNLVNINNITATGNALFKTNTNSATAFQVQNSTGTSALSVDTTTMTVTVQNLIVSTTLTVNGHIISGGTAPTVAAAAAACTTPTVTISGTDTAGTVTVVTGTGCSAAGAMATVTFNTAYTNAPRITLTPRNALSAAIGSFNGTVDTTAFTLDSSVTLAGATTYVFNYIIVQ
ncbi:VCBS repeat-containing protein, partial [Pedobacter sp.]|nr:VCBS repeat-containing protein [Candidatus Saccharibacteria bacterium]